MGEREIDSPSLYPANVPHKYAVMGHIAPFINLAKRKKEKKNIGYLKQGDFEYQTQFWISFALNALFDMPISSVSYIDLSQC